MKFGAWESGGAGLYALDLTQNRVIVEMTAGRGNVVASVGVESTKQAVYFAKAAVDAGCDAIMANSSDFNSVAPDGSSRILQHMGRCRARAADRSGRVVLRRRIDTNGILRLPDG